MPLEDFVATVKRLAADRGLSVAAVGYQAYNATIKGTNPDTFKSVMAGRRTVTPVLMEAVARVLGVKPQDAFVEYRLALARHQIDEREVGLDNAFKNLQEKAPGLDPAQAGETATQSVRRRAQDAAQRLGDNPSTSRRTRRAADGGDADR